MTIQQKVKLRVGLEPIFNTFNNGLRNDCRICRKKQHKELSYLKKQYSGTKPKDSNYRCPICDRTESDIKFTGAYDAVMRKSLPVWRLDHSHYTGKFRGWI